MLDTRHFQRVVAEYVRYYNAARLHQGIQQQTPRPRRAPCRGGTSSPYPSSAASITRIEEPHETARARDFSRIREVASTGVPRPDDDLVRPEARQQTELKLGI